jgi:hypothetical protein
MNWSIIVGYDTVLFLKWFPLVLVCVCLVLRKFVISVEFDLYSYEHPVADIDSYKQIFLNTPIFQKN